ncbi:alpha/beta-hydrolase [Hypomontagnella monticulosa]|nr:alpha/beta-hydrolase [Hypomontagnella monticulosa]
MSSIKPAIVLVPGAWTPPSAYRKLVVALKAKSFAVHVPALPSNNGVRPPNSSHEADVVAVREVIQPLVDNGQEVIVFMHSYGGIVGTNAVEGFARRDRRIGGLPGGVVHLFYLSAYLLAKGQSIWTIVENVGVSLETNPVITFENDGTWFLNDPIAALCHDLDPEDQEEQKNLSTHHNMSCIKGKTTYEAWKDIPSTYIYTTEDRCVPPVFQDICLANAKEAQVDINIEVFNCAHAAYAKYPDRLADLVAHISGLEFP